MREKCKILISSLRAPELVSEIEAQLNLLYEAGREVRICGECVGAWDVWGVECLDMYCVILPSNYQVRKSQKFRSLLIAVLLWGNFVNHGVEEEAKPPGTELRNYQSALIICRA